MTNEILIAIIAGYFMGSIPFGLIFTKMAGLGDIRKTGSGNIGATNVLRAGGLKLALLTTICDMAKAAIAFYLFGIFGGFAAVIGHNYPVWLKFKGGKGIASTFGFLFGLSPYVFLISIGVWLVVAFMFGYSSLGALVMLTVLPFIGFYFSTTAGFICLALTVLGFWRHRENIKRLIAGTESKIKWRKK
jgi:glycerol-3-phosphate acyltransferase PlsY